MARQHEADDEATSDSDLALELERELERQEEGVVEGVGVEEEEGVASCLKRGRPSSSSVGEENAEDGDVKRAKILEEERLLRADSIATSTCSKAKPPPPLPPPPPGLKGKASRLTLVDLAPEVLHRVLGCLSAQDLSACAQVCKVLQEISSENILWKRLYHFRWGLDARHLNSRGCGKGGIDDHGRRGSSSSASSRSGFWHQTYLERARATLQDSLRGCDEVMGQHIRQMYAHWWTAHPEMTFMSLDSEDPSSENRRRRESTVSDKIDEYRRKRNLDTKGNWSHRCSGDSCVIKKLSRDVFICESSGNVHVCGDACDQKVVDTNNGNFVCKVTGLVFEGQLSSAAYAGAEEKRKEQQEETNWKANAYETGYFATNEDELKLYA